MRDVFVLCSYAGHRHLQLGTIEYQDMVISIIQRLVDYAPLDADGGRPPHPVDDICQLGFLSFMTTVLHRDPRKRSSYSDVPSGLFRTRLEELYSDKFTKIELSNQPPRAALLLLAHFHLCDVGAGGL